jgi:hypothetical protein
MNSSRVSAIASACRISVIGALFLLSASKILAQRPAASVVARAELPPTEPKSGTTATLLSAVLPGLGHFYAEEPRTGAVLITLFAAGIALGAGGENSAAGPIALLVGAGPWWYGFIDAHNAAARYNHAHATNTSSFQVHPIVTVNANREVRFGIAMKLQR